MSRTPLFCLPYAGGTVALFHRWASAMPPGVLVRPVELPGHGTRHREPPITCLAELVGWIADAIAPAVSGRYALFGHSLGALLAFEVARRLRPRVGEPQVLYVSGHNAPSRSARRGTGALPDRELVAAAARWGGLPPGLDEHPALRARVLGVLRADIGIAQAYRPTPGEPLGCPVVVFAGRADPLVDRAGLAAWQRETTAPARVVMVHGGHLSVHDDSFPAVLREQLGALI